MRARFILSGHGYKNIVMKKQAVANVCARDDLVDDMKKEYRQLAEQLIGDGTIDVETLLTLLAAVRNLERMADHATNIAEDVIYMVEGKIMRHSEWN
jgi:phosphate transport system protein